MPRVMLPSMASQPPRASTPTCPSVGTACSAGLYRAISRASRTREAYSAVLAPLHPLDFLLFLPEALDHPDAADGLVHDRGHLAACCWASQLAGNSLRRDRSAMNHRAGATASATTVSSGDRNSMMTIDTTNSSTLPSAMGSSDSSDWIMLMSEIDRLTSCPVWISSCRAPSSRDSAPSISVRRSCCTSRDSRPPK